MLDKLINIFSHLSCGFALALAVIIYVDGRNPMMMFLTSTSSKVLLYAFVASVLLLNCFVAVRDRDGR